MLIIYYTVPIIFNNIIGGELLVFLLDCQRQWMYSKLYWAMGLQLIIFLPIKILNYFYL